MPINGNTFGLSSITPGDTALAPVTPKAFFQNNAPRCAVHIDGIHYVPLKVHVEINAHGATNTATITLPISPNGDFSQSLFKGTGNVNSKGPVGLYDGTITLAQATAIANTNDVSYQPVYVEIFGAYITDSNLLDPSTLKINTSTMVFQGILDKYTATLHEDKIEFAVRSLGAPLADTKVSGISLNQTIVSFLAEQCSNLGIQVSFELPPGFKPVTVAEVLGKEMIGGSQSNINNAIYGKSIMDLVKQGSVFDDTDVWEDPATGIIHYSTPSQIKRDTVQFIWNGNFKNATLDHAITQSKKIQVEVSSYTRRNTTSSVTRVSPDGTITHANTTASSSIIPGTASSVTSKANPKGGGSTSVKTSSGGNFNSTVAEGKTDYTGIDVYRFYFPGLQPARVTPLAAGLWRQISMHQYLATIEAQMTPQFLQTFSITSLMSFSNFMYQGWNSIFYPRRITMDYDRDSAWTFSTDAASDPGPPGEI